MTYYKKVRSTNTIYLTEKTLNKVILESSAEMYESLFIWNKSTNEQFLPHIKIF
jgi:hypothetical protein